MSMMILTSFGRVVRAYRVKLGISQEELAARCGLHRTYLGAIERGERDVSLINIERIANGLGFSLEELFSEVRKQSGGDPEK
jgi:transcriptional regulator with XRE-family HTH domain